MEDESTHRELLDLLRRQEAGFQVLEVKYRQHQAVRTSEEAAEVRRVPLASGAKAMLVFDSKQAIFFLAVMSAARLFDWKLLKTMTGSKSLRFATEEEVARTTRCVPGAVPPFGSLFQVRTLLDQSLIDQGSIINFNAGLRTRSVSMSISDYLRVESPTLGHFTKPKE